MIRQPVMSLVVLAIGYDLEEAVLEVEFKNGTIYQYFEVPEPIFLAVMSSGTPETHLDQHVKNVYRNLKIQ